MYTRVGTPCPIFLADTVSGGSGFSFGPASFIYVLFYFTTLIGLLATLSSYGGGGRTFGGLAQSKLGGLGPKLCFFLLTASGLPLASLFLPKVVLFTTLARSVGLWAVAILTLFLGVGWRLYYLAMVDTLTKGRVVGSFGLAARCVALASGGVLWTALSISFLWPVLMPSLDALSFILA